MPTSPASVSTLPSPKKRALEIVMPDCCNIGTVFRALLLVNGIVLAAISLRTRGLAAAMSDFLEASVILEWACLLSLLALCGLRRLLLSMGLMQALSPWSQRGLCAVTPALVTGAIAYLLGSFEWFRSSFDAMSVGEAMFTGGLFGILLQHYFELRMRAFSPALSEARLQALQARIRPHFLFNSLNAVLSLIRTEPQRAEAALEDLADLFRVLMRDTRAMTSLREEIQLCQQYLSIEKIRLGERLQVQWDTSGISEEVLQKAQISSLLLQPLLENAVRYGIEPSRTPALIEVKLMRLLDRIEVVVANPQHGQTTVSGNQMALDNIRERLALLYDMEAQLTSSSSAERFEVRLRFPYAKD